jgi:hypothetical protein
MLATSAILRTIRRPSETTLLGERSARGVLAKYAAAAHVVAHRRQQVDQSVDHGENIVAEGSSPSDRTVRCW